MLIICFSNTKISLLSRKVQPGSVYGPDPGPLLLPQIDFNLCTNGKLSYMILLIS